MTTGSHYMQTYWIEAPRTREVFNLPWVYDFETPGLLPDAADAEAVRNQIAALASKSSRLN